MTIFHWPDAVKLIEAATLAPGDWSRTLSDGTECSCMMAALLPGARSFDDFEVAGWPVWFVHLCADLFDADAGRGQERETEERNDFARTVAEFLTIPRDMDRVRDLFLVSLLTSPLHDKPTALSALQEVEQDADWWRDCESAICDVSRLLRSRSDGEDVDKQMRAAEKAASRASGIAFVAATGNRDENVCSYATDAAFFAAKETSISVADACHHAAMAARHAFGMCADTFKCEARISIVTALMSSPAERGGQA